MSAATPIPAGATTKWCLAESRAAASLRLSRLISSLQLRALTAADSDAVHALYASTRADEAAHFPLPPAQREAFLRMQSQAQQAHHARHYPGAALDAVLLDGQMIGRLCVWRRPGEIRLMDISLLPAFRGAGLGTRLLEALIGEAVQTSSVLTLHVHSDSRARAWYRRMGLSEGPDDGASMAMSLAMKTAHAAS